MAMPNMKGSGSPLLRAMYIILVPVVLLIVLLNSGWLQRLLPAATVHGETYNVVRYNYYYFDYYNSFLEENEERLASLHYDPKTSAGQQNYADGVTWREYFMQQGEAELTETAYYCDLAEAAGYVFSEEELAPIAARLAENEAERLSYGIRSANSYYVSYYGSGMNEARYTAELTRQVQAQAYKAYLIDAYQPDAASVSAWLDEHPGEDYQAAHVQIITLDVTRDRNTGEAGQAQFAALKEQLSRLADRYDRGEDFADLQAAFSTKAVGDSEGDLTITAEAGLPGILTERFLDDQDNLTAGESWTAVDEESGVGYFVVLTGLEGSGREIDAVRAVSEAAIAEQEASMSDYRVERSTIGMLLATS